MAQYKIQSMIHKLIKNVNILKNATKPFHNA